jgi:hypothetical protein
MTSDKGEAVTVSHGDMEEQNGETEESGEETVNVAKPREPGPTFEANPEYENGEVVQVFEPETGETREMVYLDGEMVPVSEQNESGSSNGNPTMPGGEPGQEIEPEPEPEPDAPHMEDRVALLEDRAEELHEAFHTFLIKSGIRVEWDHFPDNPDTEEFHELPCGHESFHESELPTLGGNTVKCNTCGGKWKSREVMDN